MTVLHLIRSSPGANTCSHCRAMVDVRELYQHPKRGQKPRSRYCLRCALMLAQLERVHIDKIEHKDIGEVINAAGELQLTLFTE